MSDRKLTADTEQASEATCKCGRRASCVGAYEGDTAESPSCDVCCGHGNEDGHCRPVEEHANKCASSWCTILTPPGARYCVPHQAERRDPNSTTLDCAARSLTVFLGTWDLAHTSWEFTKISRLERDEEDDHAIDFARPRRALIVWLEEDVEP